mgnify:FL=1
MNEREQSPVRKVSVPLWHWPNVLCLDAPVVALVWLFCLAASRGSTLFWVEPVILFLSIWLTYIADHLFDTANRPTPDLRSRRHRWTKQNTRTLWPVWFVILVLDLLLAFSLLAPWQLGQGGVLLFACLLYTLLNQRLSRRWFPKEVCVGAIFSAGVFVFLPAEGWMLGFFLLTPLFFLNCILISLKEQPIDRALRDRSLSSAGTLQLRCMMGMTILLQIALLWTDQTLAQPSAISMTLLACLYYFGKRLPTESYHVWADACLLPAPVLTLLVS